MSAIPAHGGCGNSFSWIKASLYYMVIPLVFVFWNGILSHKTTLRITRWLSGEKCLLGRPVDPSGTLETQMVEIKKPFPQVVLWLTHACRGTCKSHVYISTQQINKFKHKQEKNAVRI